jgi:hypothetical protein
MLRSSAPLDVTVNVLADVAVPAGVVTVILPLVVAVATVAVICVELFTVNALAALPLKATAVAPVKLLPVIVTEVPTGPFAGLKLEIAGRAAVTVKLLAEFAAPSGVVTETRPVVVPLATVAVIFVTLLTVKAEAALPLKATAVAPVKLVPVMATEVPTGPLVGAKLLITGGASTVNMPADAAVPPGVVTVTAPVVVLLATVAVICVALLTVNVEAAFPPNATALAPFRFAPVMVTTAPADPDVGVKFEIAGAGTTGVVLELPPPHAARASRSPAVATRRARCLGRRARRSCVKLLEINDITGTHGVPTRGLRIPYCFRLERALQGSGGATKARK